MKKEKKKHDKLKDRQLKTEKSSKRVFFKELIPYPQIEEKLDFDDEAIEFYG